MTSTIRTYKELSEIDSFIDRFNYLKLSGYVGMKTFGPDRFLNQRVYHSREWAHVKQQVIIRDSGYDMGHADHPIFGKVYVHHMNPITVDDILSGDPKIFDPDGLICVSLYTHEAIHYGDERLLPRDLVDRRPGDTKLW